jgi:tetratricopeptide (TPR) repeat protein
MVQAYRPLVEGRESPQESAWPVVMLLNGAGHHTEALALGRRVVETAEARRDIERQREGLNLLAVVAKSMGRFDEALAFLERHRPLSERSEDPSPGIANLIDRGVVHFERGEVEIASRLLEEAGRICQEKGLWRLRGAVLGNQGLIARKRGDSRAALRLFQEQEAIARRLNDLDGLHRCLSNQAVVNLDKGDHRSALKLYAKAESFCRRLGDREALLICLTNQAMACAAAGDYDRAYEQLKEKERICRERDNRAGLAETLAEQGWLIGVKLKQPVLAMKRMVEATRIAEALGSPDLLKRIMALAREIQRL